ncbi:helix-turn-helix domain-containing protein [Falcatimonas sp. MSJ-15]|uniref:helix-turn-helix domain-containing protein n=1 Tax=Falcatimonas sp. MSJ-15 TaxID=2841515 RepID=UPI001C0FE800|nr:helix-turn-helix transcriptional regulator [Falcatimonas sp. MSJ-15]MBU5469724.1 helix-turn-helix domain-containing protein [Falcatimonas sp. MSJ-15]
MRVDRENRSIGEIILNTRRNKNISISRLCRGICKESTLSRYENGLMEPDGLTFYALMQRLGISARRYDVVLKGTEEDYYRWRMATYDAVREKKWNRLVQLRNSKVNEIAEVNYVLKMQYNEYLDAIIELRCHNNILGFYEHIKRALECTLPKCQHGIEDIILGAFEIHLIYMYLYGIQKNHIMKDRELKNILEKLERYIDNRIDDKFELAKIYPRMVCVKMELIGSKIDIHTRIDNERKALRILNNASAMNDITEILKMYIYDLNEVGEKSEADKRQVQFNTLCYVMNICGVSDEYHIEEWKGGDIQAKVFREYVSAERRHKGLTQEEISSGICAVETYSRIETGKRAVSKKNYDKIRERLGANWMNYRSQIVTDDYTMLLMMTKQRSMMYNSEYNEAKAILRVLESRLDMTCTENKQYIGLIKLILQRKDNKITGEQIVKEYKHLIEITMEGMEISEVKRYYTKTELEIIYQLVMEYKNDGNVEEAEELIDVSLKNMDRRSLKCPNDTLMIKKLRAELCADMKDYAECVKESISVIKTDMENYQTEFIAQCSNLIGYALERSDKNDKEYREWYIRAIYLCDLFGYNNWSKTYKDYYMHKVDPNVKWY